MAKLNEKQPDLVSFRVTFTQDVDQKVKGLAMYMLFMVYRIFEKCKISGDHPSPVSLVSQSLSMASLEFFGDMTSQKSF